MYKNKKSKIFFTKNFNHKKIYNFYKNKKIKIKKNFSQKNI
jgi:hypothetical protein